MTDQNWKSVAEDGLPEEGRNMQVKAYYKFVQEPTYLFIDDIWRCEHKGIWNNVLNPDYITHYRYIDEPEQITESPKFKMLKMRHDIDNLAFMLKEHCESHPESVTVKGFEDSPLTLDQCEVGMELECIKYPSIPNAIIENISGSYIDTHSFRIPKSGLKSYSIHKPAPAVVHYIGSSDNNPESPCGLDYEGVVLYLFECDWSLVTCADCLKHKPETLKPSDCVGRKIRIISTDFEGAMKGWERHFTIGGTYACSSGRASKTIAVYNGTSYYSFNAKDLECCELVPEEMIEVPKLEWDKLQYALKQVTVKIRALDKMLGGGK
jgi:hypothetical protein